MSETIDYSKLVNNVYEGDFLEAPLENFPGGFPLVIIDPPYLNIVDEDWDKNFDLSFYWKLLNKIRNLQVTGDTLYWWGGTGTYQSRIFYRFASELEHTGLYTIHNHITWGKKRAYGVQHNYLYTREECLFLVATDPSQSFKKRSEQKPHIFNIPLLAEKRGYDGYDARYKAKSEYKRRTNVWSDITEKLSGKIHPTEKPEKLYDVLIQTSSNERYNVLDPMAGSGVTGACCKRLNRKFVLVEKEEEYLTKIYSRLGLSKEVGS